MLLAFDSSGRETEVVRFVPDGVEARLKYLRQFQAGTRLHLAVYIDSVRYSPIPLDEVGERHESGSDERARWRLDLASYGSRPEYETLSRVLCKVIVPPPPLDRAGVWPFEGESEDDREVSFIVGVDANGDSVEFTSNPHVLADYLGANADAPHYLTPVYFRREVLSKYFAEPERYSVEDGLLRCLGLWNTQSLQLKRFRHIHDVRARDPEVLPSVDDDELTRAQFAEKYLRAALNDKFRNRTYSKRNPTALLHRKYLEQLQVRLAQTGHIRSFEDFLAAFE